MSTSSWSSSQGLKGNSHSLGPSKTALRWLALGLETVGGLLITAIAVYLRVSRLHPDVTGLNWHQLCQDASLYAANTTSSNSLILYALVIVIPVIFIIVGEVEYSLFSKTSFFENMNKSERFCKTLPRIVRILAMFVLGIMLISFTADYFKVLIVQPRPYFLTLYGASCPLAFNGTKTEDFYEALKSFPSHLASVAGFTCVFAVGYAHKVRTSQSAPVLLPIMSQGFIVLAVTVGLDRYISHLNHIWDVVGGLLIGALLGLYMSSFVSFIITKKTEPAEEGRTWPNFTEFMIPRVTLPPETTTAEALNVRNLRQVPPNV